MSSQLWSEYLISAITDGPTLTAASRLSCIPTANRLVLPFTFRPGHILRVEMGGRVSCAVTTPGTFRLDICLGAGGTTVVYDTGALNLNIVAKTTVPWTFEVDLVCRAVGSSTSTTFMPRGAGRFTSEAVVGAALPSVGTNGTLLAPVGAPAVGAGTDVNAIHILDVFHTQTVATGSMTVHAYNVALLN